MRAAGGPGSASQTGVRLPILALACALLLGASPADAGAPVPRPGRAQFAIALGIKRAHREDTQGLLLEKFARKTGGAQWQTWQARGMVPKDVKPYLEFPRYFAIGTARAPRIHFNLDRVDLAEARRIGPSGFGRWGAYTNAELWIISQSPRLLRKTVFYRGGKPVPAPFSDPAWRAPAP